MLTIHSLTGSTTDISIENPRKSPDCLTDSPFTFCALPMTCIVNSVAGMGSGSVGAARETLLYAARAEIQSSPAVAVGIAVDETPEGTEIPC